METLLSNPQVLEMWHNYQNGIFSTQCVKQWCSTGRTDAGRWLCSCRRRTGPQVGCANSYEGCKWTMGRFGMLQVIPPVVDDIWWWFNVNSVNPSFPPGITTTRPWVLYPAGDSTAESICMLLFKMRSLCLAFSFWVTKDEKSTILKAFSLAGVLFLFRTKKECSFSLRTENCNEMVRIQCIYSSLVEHLWKIWLMWTL